MLVGGVPALGSLRPSGGGDGAPDDPAAPVGFPRLRHMAYRWLGDDLVLEGEPFWGD
jgi:3,4-dihydroxy 2-butanone 4-phosphate synthase/GTP cyclohydrolase II